MLIGNDKILKIVVFSKITFLFIINSKNHYFHYHTIFVFYINFIHFNTDNRMELFSNAAESLSLSLSCLVMFSPAV